MVDLAKMLLDKGIHGIYPTTIAKIEAGERAVRVDELAGIADLLGVSLDRLLGRRDTNPEQDLQFTLGNLNDAARQARAQLTTAEKTIRALTGELAGFDFNQREHLIGLSEDACDALVRAIEKLAYLHLSPHFMGQTQDKYMAELMGQLSWYPEIAAMFDTLKGQSE